MKATVKSDTLFKRQPVLSSELADAEKLYIASGSEFDVKFFTEAENHHFRLELADAMVAQPQVFTWYVQKADIDVQGSEVTVKALDDTVFKQRPVLSSELADAEKVFVSADSEFELQSYSPAAENHLKLKLVDTPLGNGRFDTWYANAADIKIAGQKITLKVINDTLFKVKPALLGQLAPTERVFVPKHKTFGLQSYSEVEGDFLKVTLEGSSLGEESRVVWYAFAPDVEIEGTDPRDRPQDHNEAGQVESGDRGQLLNLPGFQGAYYANDAIIKGGYFTWAQATHGGTRIPASVDVVYGMIRIAEAMEEVRVWFGNRPMTITSWYRDPATNVRVGGSKLSRHLSGDAVNFVVEDIHPNEVYSQLDPWWGARGGLASATQFTHIDARGYRARWDYGF
ncbi:MAG: D-Ala-D-Ala carboxypeptidase family metallohydrolase [Leptolyngbyaceae cyanobacterium]